MDIRIKEKRRCEVGLHNYKFHSGAKTNDQSKELLICKLCRHYLTPFELGPRTCTTHIEKKEIKHGD